MGSHLRIGLIAPPSVQVPPAAYGGTELVIDQLARGLLAAGHDVTLFTTGDSTCPVERRWIHPRSLGIDANARAALEHVEAAYAELSDVDVIHDHTVLGPLWSITRRAIAPVVTTAHLAFTPELIRLYETVGTFAAVVAISHCQRATAPSVPVAAVIHHGIDVQRSPFGTGNGGYVLFLGRISPDKGVHRAIEATRAAGKRLVIAAKMWQPEEQRYFEECVRPRLGTDAVYVGEVGASKKYELLAGAEALVNPISWPEPFGLVMIEALSTGTPVVTFARGAAPEIIDHGRTGFLCTDDADMAKKLGSVRGLDRAECRHAADAVLDPPDGLSTPDALPARTGRARCTARTGSFGPGEDSARSVILNSRRTANPAERTFMVDPRNAVRDLMSHGAISIDEKVTLRSLAAVLTELDIGVALVARPDGSVGVASERDVVRALAAGADPDEVWAADVMSDDIVFAEPDELIVDVAHRMSTEGVRHVPIVDRGTVVGVVSARDLLPVLAAYALAGC